jgi:DNA-binding NarL/FixJ family response regulator
MITVTIVEDNEDIRDGLQMLINTNNNFECKYTYNNGQEAVEGLLLNPTEVVLMDINMPIMNGIDAIKKLKEIGNKSLFIMSTIYEDDENIFLSLKAGASGYILKKTEPNKILEAISDVVNGGSPMNSQIARKVIASFQRKDPIESNEILTTREKEILKELSKGLRYKEIAASLHISMETVRSHARKIYEKLQVQSRLEALNKINNK